MHRENQHTEWKSSWRDEYLKWICGFANAGGGLLVIGRNDEGQVAGISDARYLLELLPNKVRDLLGILVAVNLHAEDGKEYLEIEVGAYPNPISYKGEYYQRSGSTSQLLEGAALDRFLLRRYGRTWDGSPLPGVSVSDLSSAAVSRFRQLAERSGRLDTAALNEPDAAMLDKLKLTEGAYLKRAAVLLFHPDPERFVTGASIKVGYFASESDLRYHDEIAGDLFTQAGKTMELLLTKYLKAVISHEGIQRIESFPVPEAALREALLNAIVHRDYAVPAPIQIRIYEDRLSIWNPGEPEDWTQATLMGPHASRPSNPDIANTFFRAGEIEAWGHGRQHAARLDPPPTTRVRGPGAAIPARDGGRREPLLRGTPLSTQHHRARGATVPTYRQPFDIAADGKAGARSRGVRRHPATLVPCTVARADPGAAGEMAAAHRRAGRGGPHQADEDAMGKLQRGGAPDMAQPGASEEAGRVRRVRPGSRDDSPAGAAAQRSVSGTAGCGAARLASGAG